MRSRRSALWRIGIYAAVVAIIFVVVAATGSLPSAAEARDFGESLGGFAVAAYVPLFVIGVGIFTIASLLCGLAWSGGVLIGARVVQGVSAAIMAPTALSILMTTFEEGPERNKALGIWSAIGGMGATAMTRRTGRSLLTNSLPSCTQCGVANYNASAALPARRDGAR